MRAFIRNNSLSLVFLGLFLTALVLQSIAGLADFNEDQVRHGDPHMSYGRYLVSSEFATAVMENWQSEYLQFFLFILTTVWLLQKGSPESKELDNAGTESEQEQLIREHASPDSPKWARVGGARTWLFSNSLLIVMGLIFVGSWFAQSVTGWSSYNADQIEHEQEPLSWVQYVGSADFWQTTLQNWQSEFLAVGSMAVLSIYLRQRGSPESKPVGAAHAQTGVEG
jgi:hypothetical protein